MPDPCNSSRSTVKHFRAENLLQFADRPTRYIDQRGKGQLRKIVAWGYPQKYDTQYIEQRGTRQTSKKVGNIRESLVLS